MPTATRRSGQIAAEGHERVDSGHRDDLEGPSEQVGSLAGHWRTWRWSACNADPASVTGDHGSRSGRSTGASGAVRSAPRPRPVATGLRCSSRSSRARYSTSRPARRSWEPLADQVQAHEWSRRWLAEQWPEWPPRTRASAVEVLSRRAPGRLPSLSMAASAGPQQASVTVARRRSRGSGSPTVCGSGAGQLAGRVERGVRTNEMERRSWCWAGCAAFPPRGCARGRVGAPHRSPP